MDQILNAIKGFLGTTGIANMFSEDASTPWWQYLIMYCIIGALFYLAIVKKFEPLLLMPIAFGMLLANLPGANLIHLEYFFDEHYFNVDDSQLTGVLQSQFEAFFSFVDEITHNGTTYLINFEDYITYNVNSIHIDVDGLVQAYEATGAFESSEAIISRITTLFENNFAHFVPAAKFDLEEFFKAYESNNSVAFNDFVHIKMSTMIKEVINHGGLLDILYLGVKLGVYPSLIFLGVGAMTDFSPLIANPKSLLMGAGAQFGVFAAFFFALFLGFTPMQAGAIGIIGGADGPTAILVTKELAPELLGAIAIAAYSYMALIPIIQPPFMKLLTTEKERKIKMTNLRPVSRIEKVIFPIVVTAIVCLIIPDAAPLVGFLMLGNLFNVSGVADRLSKTAQNELINIVTICLGVSVGATANAGNFLKLETLYIIGLGLAAFCISTVGGLLTGKLMCKLTGGKINPLIGSAGVSAVPMAARVAQDVGRKYDPTNFLLMHAMGPNVAGVIGSAVAAGVFLSFLG
ncbi:MAG: sodium ion-translocating decarboxylase subunit beta [Clostridia bacterium]|nr:sodium ion-translocating decarboxylase subunit beta [Clostridia bacterium]